MTVERDGGLRVTVSGTAVTTIAASGTWLAWGAAAADVRDVSDPHEVVAVDTATGQQLTVPALGEGGVLTPFAATRGRFVVRELRFEDGCADGGTHGCVTWRLWSYDPRTGERADLAASDRPRSQDANPTVVAGPDWVAWQESRGDGVHLRVLRDGATEPATVHTSKFRSTSLAVAGDAVVFDDPDRRGRLLQVRAGRGPAVELVTAPVTYLPGGGTTFVSWFGGTGDAPTRLYAAPLRRPLDARLVGKSAQMYWQLGHGDRLLYGAASGVWLVDRVTAGGRPRLLTRAADHRVGYAFGPDGRLFYAEAGDEDHTETTIVTT